MALRDRVDQSLVLSLPLGILFFQLVDGDEELRAQHSLPGGVFQLAPRGVGDVEHVHDLIEIGADLGDRNETTKAVLFAHGAGQ